MLNEYERKLMYNYVLYVCELKKKLMFDNLLSIVYIV